MAEARNENRRWHRLDNTANLFPVITTKKTPNVYRLSLNLSEPVAPELLQQALEKVLPRFAAFRVRLRRGVFWHYLEQNTGTPTIQLEDDYPCRTIDPAQNNQFLFRVSYYESRINLEIFHVLTDGTGGLQFLQALCCQYLMLAHPSAFTEEQKATPWFAEHATHTEDGYVQNYTPTKKTNFNIGRGYFIKGERNLLENLSVIHAHTPVPPLLALCREKGVTITQYLTACIGWAVYTQQLQKRPARVPLNIFVPVNLRKLFGTNTSLNFFSNIYISLRFDHPGITFDAVLEEVQKQFCEKVSREAMEEKISYTVGNGYNPFVRLLPLPLKNLGLRFIYNQSAKSSSLGFSNVGQVTMPPPFQPFVTGASFMLSTVPQEPLKVAACSYDGLLTVSLTSILRSTSLQMAFVRRLTQDGLDVTIETNGVDYESL